MRDPIPIERVLGEFAAVVAAATGVPDAARCPATTGCPRAGRGGIDRCVRRGAGVGAAEAISEQQSIGPRAKKSLFECCQPHSQVSARVSSRVPRHGGLAQHNQQFHQG